MPATEITDFEREFEELVRDLRALPTAAPEPLRARVRALEEPAQQLTWRERFAFVPWRRSLLVLAPACVLGLVVAAVVHGVLNSGPQREAVSTVVHGEAAGKAGAAQGGAADNAQRLAPVFGAATTPSALASPLPTPTPGRYQDYEAWLAVRVKDVDALSDRTN